MKHEKDNSVKAFFKANVMQLFSLIMLSLATYITYRLAPLSQDLALTRVEVKAMQEDVIDLRRLQESRISKDEVYTILNDFKQDNSKQFTEVKSQIQYLIQLHVK